VIACGLAGNGSRSNLQGYASDRARRTPTTGISDISLLSFELLAAQVENARVPSPMVALLGWQISLFIVFRFEISS
jgi:hypothetical protein